MQDHIEPKKKYGNMLVLSDRCCLISFGPDYLCFFPTFTMFCVVSYYLCRMVLRESTNSYFIAATFIICIATCLSYLAVAISNPGVVLESQEEEDENQPLNEQQSKQKYKVCKKCNFKVKRGTRHCSDCDVCVQGYDHHCPWTSKCIGRGNIIQFYAFLVMVPTYLVYIFVAFTVVMSMAINQANKRHIRGH